MDMCLFQEEAVFRVCSLKDVTRGGKKKKKGNKKIKSLLSDVL